LNDSIYWHDNDGVYVNLFMPSELNWAEKGFRLRQETKFPESPNTKLVVIIDKPMQMPMHLRIPSWLESSATIKINGKAIEASATPGSYLTVSRTWKNGDSVEMELPMHLRIEAMPDDSKVRAVLYGPVVLAGDLGSEGLSQDMIVGPSGPMIARAPQLKIPSVEFVPATTIPAGRSGRNSPERHVPAVMMPALRASGSDPGAWIKPGDQPLTFRTTGQQQDVTLVPLNSIFDKRYTVYWQVG
jgi:uncharacterized protein